MTSWWWWWKENKANVGRSICYLARKRIRSNFHIWGIGFTRAQTTNDVDDDHEFIYDFAWLFMTKILTFEELGSLVLRLLIQRDVEEDHEFIHDNSWLFMIIHDQDFNIWGIGFTRAQTSNSTRCRGGSWVYSW